MATHEHKNTSRFETLILLVVLAVGLIGAVHFSSGASSDQPYANENSTTPNETLDGTYVWD